MPGHQSVAIPGIFLGIFQVALILLYLLLRLFILGMPLRHLFHQVDSLLPLTDHSIPLIRIVSTLNHSRRTHGLVDSQPPRVRLSG